MKERSVGSDGDTPTRERNVRLKNELESELDVALSLRAGDLAEGYARHAAVRSVELRRVGDLEELVQREIQGLPARPSDDANA
jgi:hypothetical protein